MPVATRPCYVIRQALAQEQGAICALVRSERLNPHHLHFENFAVAVRGAGLIGASQIRRHKDGSRELGSVVVAKPWRGRGIAIRKSTTSSSDSMWRRQMSFLSENRDREKQRFWWRR